MKRQCKEKESIDIIPGQLSFWDIPKKTAMITKIEENITKITDSYTETGDLYSKLSINIVYEEIEKPLNLLILTEEQRGFISKNKVLENDNLQRLIHYGGGGIGIEILQEGKLLTQYINKDGKKEFLIEKRSPVLPMDKILYAKEDLSLNEVQQQKLKKLHKSALKIIKRFGDENIILKFENKVTMINFIGWVLDFRKIEDKNKTIDTDQRESFEKNIKVGDKVEFEYRNKRFLGEVYSNYGPANCTLNIIYNYNGKKHTAINKSSVIRVIQEVKCDDRKAS